MRTHSSLLLYIGPKHVVVKYIVQHNTG